MKDTAYPIRKAYFTLISGLGYSVYDSKAPDNASKPYVILASQTSQDESNKSTFNNRVTINIDVITAFNDGFGGRKSLDLIVDAILTAAIPQPHKAGITVSGFNIFGTQKTMDMDFDPYISDTQTVYRRVITIEHLLQQI